MKKRSLLDQLEGKLTSHELRDVYKSYDIIGDIAVIRVPDELQNKSIVIAEALMQLHRNVKTVLRQLSAVSGEFRLRGLVHVAGEKKTVTLNKEHDCAFRVDLMSCYFSPRLSNERMRIARLVGMHEVVVNMFAGVGSFSIAIAKHSQAQRVYSIDVNPVAYAYMKENTLLNRVWNRVVPLKGDAKEVITEKLQHKADRVLMPLPERAYEYLDCAVAALRPEGGWVHYYDFAHAGKNENIVDKVNMKVAEKLSRLNLDFSIPFGRVVRDTGPRWQQIVLDIEIRGKT